MFFVLAVIGGVGYGGYELYKSPLFNLKNLNYSYSEGITEDSDTYTYLEHVRPQLEKQVSKYVGKSLWELDIFEIEKELETLPWVQNIIITRRFPSDLHIEIEPKKIVANIIKTPSKVQPVAYDSTLLSDVEITKAPSVPILSSKHFVRSENLRKKALQFLSELPEEGSFSYREISEISPFRNDEFQVLLKNSKALVLINVENVPIKAERISRVIEYMDPSEMKGRVIDSNFSKKVLVRPRNHR
jgi:hypothetical protein